MPCIIDEYTIVGTPPPWSVTGVNSFVVGALQRVQRDGSTLPPKFWFSSCPWGERNALGGTPQPVQEVVDPRFRLVHFTGCGRPYLVILFLGADAAAHQQIAKEHLPWSEHFAVTCTENKAILNYLGCTEDIGTDMAADSHTLQELLERGILADF